MLLQCKVVAQRFKLKLVAVELLLSLVARVARLALVLVFKYSKEISLTRDGDLHMRDGSVGRDFPHARFRRFFGVVREAWNGTSSCRGLRLTQSDYTAKVLEDAVKLGFGPIRVCTTAGQAGTPLDPKLLPERPCDPGVRGAHWEFTVPVTLHTIRPRLCCTAREVFSDVSLTSCFCSSPHTLGEALLRIRVQ